MARYHEYDVLLPAGLATMDHPDSNLNDTQQGRAQEKQIGWFRKTGFYVFMGSTPALFQTIAHDVVQRARSSDVKRIALGPIEPWHIYNSRDGLWAELERQNTG